MCETGTETIELGLTRGKKTWKRYTTSKKKKRRTKSFPPLNVNLNLFYGTRIIMTAKKILFFCGHKKIHIEKKRYWQLVYKGGKNGVVE